MNEIKFEGVCWHCTEAGRSEVEARVTGNGVSRPWRHDQRPANGHQAWPI